MTFPGGKAGAGVYQTIINLMPPHQVYIEPFLGGGAIMRLKRPAALNIGVDLDPAVVEGWRNNLVATPKVPMVARIDGPGDGGSALGGSGERRRRRSPEPAILDVADPIVEAGDVRSHFRFLQGDGIAFLRAYAFACKELVYCDPPYLMSTRSGRRLYRFEMTPVHHRHLLRVLQDLPCRVMISGYWSPLYAETLKDWQSVTFQAMTRGRHPATEWLWFNFEPPVALHDYQYLGRTFRERERIHRKQRRWCARLAHMPLLERQALLSAVRAAGIIDDGGDGVLH